MNVFSLLKDKAYNEDYTIGELEEMLAKHKSELKNITKGDEENQFANGI